MKKTISKTRKSTFWMFFKVVNLLLLIAVFATTKYYSSYFINDYCLDKGLSELEHKIWNKRSHHKLRKCAATNWVTTCYENGDDPWIYIPQWLGHKSLWTTFKYIYFEALFHKRADVLETLSLESTKYGKKFKKKFENSNG